MKKTIANIIFGLCMAAAMTFTGCRGLFDPQTSESAKKNGNPEYGYISVSSLEGAVQSGGVSSMARSTTILETQFSKIMINKVELWAAGTSDGDTDGKNKKTYVLKAEKDITDADIASGASTAVTGLLGTWTSDEDATEDTGNAILKMQADKNISVNVGTYTFHIKLFDESGECIATGKLENKTITNTGVNDTGYNLLDFNVTPANGKGATDIVLKFDAAARVTSVKAGLFDVFSGDAVEGFDFVSLQIVTKEDGSKSVKYEKAGIPQGTYMFIVEFYGKQGSAEDSPVVLINKFSDAIYIRSGMTTIADRTVSSSDINTIYSVTYVLNNGAWKEGVNPVTTRNANTAVALPTAADVYRQFYSFMGWYTDAELTVAAGDFINVSAANNKDLTYYAKWEANDIRFTVRLHESAANEYDMTGEENGNRYLFSVHIPDSLSGSSSKTVSISDYKWFIDNRHVEDMDGKQQISVNVNDYAGGSHDVTVSFKEETTYSVEVTNGGQSVITTNQRERRLSSNITMTLEKLPDFPITYRNAVFTSDKNFDVSGADYACDFAEDDFTGKHQDDYPTVFYYGGQTALDYPTDDYYDFGGYYLNADATGDRILSLNGTTYRDAVTLYAKWTPKNPVKVSIHENNSVTKISDYEKIYILGSSGEKSDSGTEKWTAFDKFIRAEDKTAELRSKLYRTGGDYYAFAPVSAITTYIDSASTAKEIAVSYKEQKQTENGSIDHLKAYDFMTGKITATGNKSLDSELTLKQVGEQLQFTVGGLADAGKLKKMVLYIPEVYIPTEGKIDMSAAEPAFVTTETVPADNYNHFFMDLDFEAVDGTAVINTMLPPVDASGKTLIVTLIDENDAYYVAYFEGKDFVANHAAYTFSGDAALLPHYVTLNGLEIATHNYGAYSPEDYGTLYNFAEANALVFANANADGIVQLNGGKVGSYADYAKLAEAPAETITATSATASHGVHGVTFTSADGSVSVFIPANGYNTGEDSVNHRGGEANIWTSETVTGAVTTNAYILYGSKDDAGLMAYSDKSYKYGVRPVK